VYVLGKRNLERVYNIRMAKHDLHDRAIDMRKLGMSYSQIKNELNVSKSSLSLWLHNYPLTPERVQELRASNERQIERIRQTKAKKREARLDSVFDAVRDDIGPLSDRELFLSGVFLYWAEGAKTSRNMICLTNTDPAMLLFFIRWLKLQGVERTRLRCHLHLYADMDIGEATRFWSETLTLPTSAFRKPYVKKSFKDKRKNYKGRFGYGTCNLILYDRDIYERVMMGMRYVRELSGGDRFPIHRAV
jgi:hypothetical protein